MPPEDRADIYVFYGALRSGTTLLRLMLDAHPEMHCPGERDFLVDFLKPTEQGLIIDRDALALHRIFRASGLTLPDTDDGPTAFWDMLAEDRARSGKRVYLIVLHRGMKEIEQLFPQARYIHLLRDPRDVAQSSIGMGWAGNAWFGADHWIETEREWQAHRPPADRVFDLRYEDLLNDPKDCLSRLCAFIGLTFHDEMLAYDKTSSYAPVDPRLAEQWRRKQSAQAVSEVEHKLGDLLHTTGYAPSDAGPAAPGVLRMQALRVQNRAAIWRTRIKRFGVLDPILVGLARRTGASGLGQAAQLRIDKKMQAYLK